MSVDEKTEELIREVELMGRCYLKGFINTIHGISTYASLCVVHPEEMDEYRSEAMKSLEKIEKSYGQIPFNELVPHSDFSPLFVVKYLLSLYSKQVKDCFERPSKELNEKVCETTNEIVLFCGLFRDKFKEKMERLRQIPGYKNFGFEFVDYQGIKWSSDAVLSLDH